MKKIIYARSDGRCCVVHPAEGARLAHSVTFADGSRIESPEPIPADQFHKRWPVKGAVAEWAETEDKFLDRIRPRVVPQGATDVQVVGEAVIPADRTFRNAWKAGQGRVEHDMAKCREIKRAELRSLRAPKMAALDVEYIRADEAGDTAAKVSIAAKKRALRDVTSDPAIEAAKTPEELKAVMPEVLK